MKKTLQHSFKGFDHDSLQFHFYSENFVGACRLFYTKSLCHSSVWIYVDGKIKEIFSSSNPIKSKNDNFLDVRVENLSVKEIENKQFQILLDNENLSIHFKSINLETWNDTRSNVIHLPNMVTEIKYEDNFYQGIGYAKRYSWRPSPTYWGYRFIQGFNNQDQSSIWTAEATFGTKKYDYFKILKPNGQMINTVNDMSYHRQNHMEANTTQGSFKIELEEMDLWEVKLESQKMNSLLRQRVCKFNAKLRNKRMSGFAINETCYGTLG